MVVCLTVLFAVLRIGLKMRRRRLGGAPRDLKLIRLHLKLAKPAVLLTMLGFIGGGLSSSLIRNWSLFETFHSLLGLITLCLFALTAYFGLRAERSGFTSNRSIGKFA